MAKAICHRSGAGSVRYTSPRSARKTNRRHSALRRQNIFRGESRRSSKAVIPPFPENCLFMLIGGQRRRPHCGEYPPGETTRIPCRRRSGGGHGAGRLTEKVAPFLSPSPP